MNIVGKTTDGILVIDGVYIFRLSDTKGLPLEFILTDMYLNDCVVDWDSYINQSIKSGWKLPGTLEKIRYATREVYGKVYSDTIIEIINNRKYL